MLKPLLIEGRPHWETRFPEEAWPLYEDFRNFLLLVWEHLGLPEPTPAQLEIAHRLQYGYDTHEAVTLDLPVLEQIEASPREDIVRCFRSLGKSYITSAYAIWRLMRNPRDEKILVVSASGSKAKEFVSQTKGILESLTECQWLLKGSRMTGATRRDKADEFDVAGSSLSQSYSVAARGVTGQITGSRATLLIADDIEVERNSLTEEARSRLLRTVESDFVPIVKTEHGRGDIIFLGTPQTEESVYNTLVIDKGFRCITIPVEFPGPDQRAHYRLVTTEGVEVDIFAPYLQALIDDGTARIGHPTDSRFTLDELLKIKAKGRSAYALQYMLDTSLSDADRYPLRQSDLLVFSTNPGKAPLRVQWGHDKDRKNYVTDIPNLGFTGDHFLRPLFVDSDWTNYSRKVCFVDPAGRGKDETAWAIGAELNGMIYVLSCRGERDPDKAMRAIAAEATRFEVDTILVEPNMGDGMWAKALRPIVSKASKGAIGVEDAPWASGQKERRILDVLEPVTAQHRLVFDESLVRAEAKPDEPRYSLLYQWTHITRERGALSHDDRIEAVTGLVHHFASAVGQDVEEAHKAVMDEWWEEEIESYMESAMSTFGARRGKVRETRSFMERTRYADGSH